MRLQELRIRRDEGGFGFIEMLIALTMLAIGIAALGGVFVAAHLSLRRASESDAATVLADNLMERFRAETWDNIALSSASVTSAMADSWGKYENDEALTGNAIGVDITEANAPAAADGSAAATDCTNTPTPIACNASLTVPYNDGTVTETAPDHRSYRIDTYVTWGCPATQGSDAQTLGGTVGAPTCSLVSDGSLVPFAPVKVVTIVVRDATTHATVYRTSSSFDRLTGVSMPTPTAVPTSTTGTTSTTGGGGSSNAPDAPASVLLANGGGTGGAYINSGNESSVSVDVSLASTGQTATSVALVVSDAGGHSWSETAPASSSLVHFTGIDVSGWNEGDITLSATASNSSGTSNPAIQTVTMDVTPPTVTLSSPISGATHYGGSGPFAGTGGDSTVVNVQFCQHPNSWNCGATPTETADAVLSGGNWSLTLTGTAVLTGNNYVVRAQGTDTAGNVGTSAVVAFGT